MPVRGEELNIDKGVGFILAMLFGFVIGLSLWATLHVKETFHRDMDFLEAC